MERLENGCSMKLTDMNFDCLVSCFRYLSIEELLNVADSNKQLKCAASYVFARSCDRKTVVMDVLKSCYEKCGCKRKVDKILLKRMEKENIACYVYHLKMGLQLLRCFGDLVFGVEVSFQITYSVPDYMIQRFDYLADFLMQCAKAYEYEPLIIDYINEYCSSQSLTNIKFSGNPLGDLKKLTKEFVNVEKLEMNTVFPTEKTLVELFPKVRQLELDYSRITDTCDRNIVLHNDIARHFPYLEHLMIVERECEFNIENAATALRLNPQLKTLKGDIWIDVIFNTDIFRDSTEHLQHLETLELIVKNDTLYAKTIGKNIHLRNMKELSFVVYNTHWEPCAIPFSSDKLESLTIFASYITDLNNIIDKYPTLKKLIIDANPVEFNFSRMSKALPLLEEICIDCGRNWVLTFDTVRLVINSFPFLRLFKFFSSLPFETDWTRLLNGWSISHELRDKLFEFIPITNPDLKTVLKRQN